MYAFLISIHVIVCVLLALVILLQSSKGGGLAGVFGGGGGGGMNAVFGGRGAGTFLTKSTTVLAFIFMALALILGRITRGGQEASSVISQERARGNIVTPADVLPTVPTDAEPLNQPLPVAPVEESAATDENEN